MVPWLSHRPAKFGTENWQWQIFTQASSWLDVTELFGEVSGGGDRQETVLVVPEVSHRRLRKKAYKDFWRHLPQKIPVILALTKLIFGLALDVTAKCAAGFVHKRTIGDMHTVELQRHLRLTYTYRE